MATEAQIRANQQNAQKSTGPVTDAGKARSSQNARIHGFCAQTLSFISVEERDAFLARCAEISDQYAFEHALKQSLVTAIAAAEVQIRNINLAKRGVLRRLTAGAHQYSDETRLDALVETLGTALLASPDPVNCLTKLNRYEAEQHRIFHRALAELERLYREYKSETKPISLEKKPFPPEKQQRGLDRKDQPEVKSRPPKPKAA